MHIIIPYLHYISLPKAFCTKTTQILNFYNDISPQDEISQLKNGNFDIPKVHFFWFCVLSLHVRTSNKICSLLEYAHFVTESLDHLILETLYSTRSGSSS